MKAARRTEAERLQAKLRTELRRFADPEKAAGAQAYMKSRDALLRHHGAGSASHFQGTFRGCVVSDCGSLAQRSALHLAEREVPEERYFAISFCV